MDINYGFPKFVRLVLLFRIAFNDLKYVTYFVTIL